MKRRDLPPLPFASILRAAPPLPADAGNLKKLRVGVTATPATEMLVQVAPLANSKGHDIQIFEKEAVHGRSQP